MLKYLSVICIVFDICDAEARHSDKMVSLEYVLGLGNHDLNCPLALLYSLR